MRIFSEKLLQLAFVLLFIFIPTLTHAEIPAQSIKKHGMLLDHTELPAVHRLQEAAEQYRIHYTSIDGVDGKSLREDSGALFLPKGAAPQGGWPVVVWAHGTVGLATQCAPSLNPHNPRDAQYLNTWLSLGFAVLAPDYAGLGSSGLHHYLHGRAEAFSLLDSILAVSDRFLLRNQFILVGQSQGGHAAFAAAGYQPEYAPNLNIVATVLTGTPYFNATTSIGALLTATGTTEGGDPKMPYLIYSYLAAADRQPDLKIDDYFQPKAIPEVKQAKDVCIGPLAAKIMRQELNAGNALKPAIYSLLDQQTIAMRYKTLKIDHPVFIGMGSADIDVPVLMQKLFARDLNAAGTQVEVHEYEGLDHSSTLNPSLRDSVPFVLQRLKDVGSKLDIKK